MTVANTAPKRQLALPHRIASPQSAQLRGCSLRWA